MFIEHDKILRLLTPEKQEELNGMSFAEIKKSRTEAVKKQCWWCRRCTGVRPTYEEGVCDGMLTEAERLWIKNQIQVQKST